MLANSVILYNANFRQNESVIDCNIIIYLLDGE